MGIWKVVGEVLQVGFGNIAGVILLVRLLMWQVGIWKVAGGVLQVVIGNVAGRAQKVEF